MFLASGSRARFGWGQRRSQSGGLQLVTEGVVAAAATLDLVLTGLAEFRGIRIVLTNLIPVTDIVQLIMRLSTNGGVSFDAAAGNYRYALNEVFSAGSTVFSSASATFIAVTDANVGNDAVGGVTAIIDIFDHTSAVIRPKALIESTFYAADDNVCTLVGGGRREAAQDTDAAQFLFSSGNIASGRHAVYGWA
jgi:hypothetical protein